MSWFASLFTLPAPHDAKARPHEQRLLEEPVDATKKLKLIDNASPSFGPSESTSSQQQPTNRNRNKVIFGAGLTFFAFSLLVTKRSLARRRSLLSSQLTNINNTTNSAGIARNNTSGQSASASTSTFYTNAPEHAAAEATKVSGAMEAVEALNIATINVLSLVMMVTGGALWYLDINSMDDARKFLRGGLGVDGTGKSEKEAEEDFEVWLARTLAKGEAKDAAAVAATRQQQGSSLLEIEPRGGSR